MPGTRQSKRSKSVKSDASENPSTASTWTLKIRQAKRRKLALSAASKKPRKSSTWTMDEMRLLVEGLDKHGLDLIKLAEIVKTKNMVEVTALLKKCKDEVIHSEKRRIAEQKQWNATDDWPPEGGAGESVESWAPLEFWMYVARYLGGRRCNPRAYCKVFEAVFRKAADSESHVKPRKGEPDFRLINAYFANALGGSRVLPKLPPAECTLVLNLIQDLCNFVQTNDWPAEKAFLATVLEKPKILPIKENKKLSSELLSESSSKQTSNSGTNAEATSRRELFFPKEVCDYLKFPHKMMQRSINPFFVPVSLLQAEQEIVHNYFNKKKS